MSYGVNINNLRTSAEPFSIDELKSFGSTLVFAPHPDDESLACGGIIALLRSVNIPVHVIFVSDGSLSHPGSKKFPADVLAALRAREALAALSFLDVSSKQVHFMRLKDGSVPQIYHPGFKKATEAIAAYLTNILPSTIILPWRRDTHPDHRACWQLVNNALLLTNKSCRMLEYPLWLWERGTSEDMPLEEEAAIRSVNIKEWLQVKTLAINAHQSQVTGMIDDDPDGFWLSPEVIAHFTRTEEIFLSGRVNSD